jgi:hypothetical protein
MECHQDSGIIEKSKKKNQYVFVPDDWTKIVANLSNKLTILRLGIQHFVSLQPMSDIIKDSVKVLCVMLLFLFVKDQPYKFFYKNTINKDMPFSVTDLRKSRQVGKLTKKSRINKTLQ